MKNNFKKILSFLLVFIITFSSSIPVFAENRANSHYFNLLNVQSSESENVNEEVKKIFPYGEIVGKVLTTDSVIKNNTKNRDGYIFIKEFGETIGYDGKKSLSKLKVVLSESGGVITAYPIE